MAGAPARKATWKAPPPAPPDPPEEIESPFPRHIVFDFRWMSGELVIRFDSDDPYWWPYKGVDDVTQHMDEGLFDWLPPREEDANGYAQHEYQLFYNGEEISGDWDNTDLPFGATVYVVRLRREMAATITPCCENFFVTVCTPEILMRITVPCCSTRRE